MQLKVEECSDCLNIAPIVNRKYKLCQSCNTKRLHPGKEQKTYELKRTPLKVSQKPIKQHSKKSKEVLKKDDVVYHEVFLIATQNGSCECENCQLPLYPDFKDENGKVAQRFRYSHILTKGAFPEFRHNPLNFNFLCFNCHQIWEFGGDEGRGKMRIYEKNEKIIDLLLTH